MEDTFKAYMLRKAYKSTQKLGDILARAMESQEPTLKGRQGEIFVFKYLLKKGYNPVWVRKGYDIKATIDGEERRIEVKTTKNMKPVIPDMNITEFKGTLTSIPKTGIMKATHLYIVTGWGDNAEHKIYVLDTKRIEKHVKSSARAHRGRHVGGPGQPDYIRGKIHGEVKSWNRPMSKADVMREARKGRNELTSKRGFTQSAIEYTHRYRPNMKLFHRKKRVK